MSMNILAIQLNISASMNKTARLSMVADILTRIEAGDQKPDLILLPEIWGCGFNDFDNYANEAETLEGPTAELLSHWATRLGCFFLGGSIIETSSDTLYNTSLFFNRQGNLEGTYRKMHLFGYQSKEQALLTRGQTPVVLNTELGIIGLSTCYDLRFPEQYRKMVDMGAEMFLVVSAWPVARLAHWRLFNQVRALENQCWLVSCNSAGIQNGSLYAGHSMTVSPMGKILAEASTGPGTLWSQVELAQVAEYRHSFPALTDRINF